MDCIFCKIASGKISTNLLYEDELCVAFDDIDPQAPVHFLVVPKTHVESANDINIENEALIGHIFSVIKAVAQKKGLSKGYRIVNNCGEYGGQSVSHIHFHVLGGKALSWPPYDTAKC